MDFTEERTVGKMAGKRCGYCGRKTGGEGFCSRDCESRYEKALGKDRGKIGWFVLGMAVMFWGVFSFRDRLMGAGLLLMGLTVLLLPFTTPETTELLGYRRSRMLGRLLGLLLAAVGVWTGWL